MKCNLFYVAERLGALDSLKLKYPERAMVTRVQVYTDACDRDDSTLIVARGDRELALLLEKERRPLNVAWIKGDGDTIETPPDLNLLTLGEGTSVDMLEEAVQGTLSDRFIFEEHIDRCLAALGSGDGLQVLVNEIFDNFGFPTAVSKTNGIIDAVTSNYHASASFVDTNIQTMFVDTRIYEKPEFKERRQNMTSTAAPVVSKVSLETREGVPFTAYFLDQAISRRGEIIGYVSTVSRVPFTEWQKDCVQKYDQMAGAVLINRYQQDERKETAFETMISEILTGTLRDRQMIELRLKRIEPEVKPYHFLLLVRSRNPELPRVRTAAMLQLRNVFQRAPVIRNGDDLVVVYYCSHDYFSLDDQILEWLKKYLEIENLVIGISRMFTDYADIPTCYGQAEKAIYYGLKSHWEDVIFPYEAYMHFHAFEMLSGMIRPEWLTSHQLHTLCSSEDESDRELVQTLRTWLRCNKDVRHVTEELHIHRNTLYYRLNKIKDILHIESYDSGEIIFYLQWSLAFEDYLRMIKG